jgi:hypothetical protein
MLARKRCAARRTIGVIQIPQCEVTNMPISEVLKKINDAEKTAQNTSPELAIPYILSALREIAKVLQELGAS